MVNLGVKLKVSSSNRSEIYGGSQNSKSRSRDHIPTTFDLILHFSLVLLVVNLLAKFEVCSSNCVPEIWRGPKISKAGHVTSSRPVNGGRR